jgi:hypothetical protein
MAEWGFTLEDKDKNVLAFLTTFQAMTLTMPLNGPATCSGTISHNSADMTALYSQLNSGAVFLRAVRNGTTRFWGVLNDLQVSLDDSATASVGFVDIAGLYATVANYVIGGGKIKMFFKQNPLWTSTITDLLNAGSPLVRLTRSGSPTGRVPVNETVANATGHAKLKGKVWKPQSTTVLESLQELGGFASGIEWYVTPDATLTVYNTLGSNKASSVFFQYGQDTLANADSATVSYQPPANSLFWTDPKGVLHRSASGYSSSSVAAYGEYSSTYNSMARRDQSDDDRSAARLRTSWRKVIEITPDPVIAPQPWTDYFLGDTVSVRVKRDSLDLVTSQRINKITVGTDDQNRETVHQLEFEVI